MSEADDIVFVCKILSNILEFIHSNYYSCIFVISTDDINLQ